MLGLRVPWRRWMGGRSGLEATDTSLVISRAHDKLVVTVKGSLIVRDGEPADSILPDDRTRLSLEEFAS
jgi:hypothetical protein